ncbi:hypothetical protein GCM10010182_71230 [Actinomadura cremea]|nr:hypothetical protein GCM10010182_71230 [Actinomadura cremea]
MLTAAMQTNLNRRQTAAKFRVHPTTVDYRIAALAALDAEQITACPSLA